MVHIVSQFIRQKYFIVHYIDSYLTPSGDDLVTFTRLLWFFFAFIAGLALIFDQCFIPFIPRVSNNPLF